MEMVILLGAGASVPSGMPSTATITERVLSGDGVVRGGGEYFFHAGTWNDDDTVPRLVQYIGFLSRELTQEYTKIREGYRVNYEDIYYLANQTYEHVSAENYNPALWPFIERTLSKIAPLLQGQRRYDVVEFARESVSYIRGVILESLAAQPGDLAYLDAVLCAAVDQRITKLTIATLNHDQNIERRLRALGLRFVDGFGSSEQGLRVWKPSSFDRRRGRMPLLKLHGSINWFRYQAFIEDQGNIIADFVATRPDDPNDKKAERFWAQRNAVLCKFSQPNFLVGTYNKLEDYVTGQVYLELHYQFHRATRTAQVMLACGYGFGDKGINSRIIYWLFEDINRRLIVVHPEPDGLRLGATPAIQREWQTWVNRGQLLIVPRLVQVTSWYEISCQLFGQ